MAHLRSLWNVVRVATVAVWTAIWVSVAFLVSALAGSRRPGLALARLAWAPGMLWIAGVRLTVQGRDRLDLSRAVFYAVNHQSWIDIPVLFQALPAPILFVGKRELARVPFLGWYMAAMGMVFIDRDDRLAAGRSVARAADRLAQGWSLLSFPEGTRSPPGEVRRFKPGTFAAAIAAGAPVVPVAIEGAGRVVPRRFFAAKAGRVRLTIGEPIPTAGLPAAGRGDLARRTQAAVEALLARRP